MITIIKCDVYAHTEFRIRCAEISRFTRVRSLRACLDYISAFTTDNDLFTYVRIEDAVPIRIVQPEHD